MLTRKHRRFSDAKWALSGEIVSRIESITDKLAPQNPLARHRMLFSGHGRYLYEEMGDLQEQKLEEQRRQAIEKILDDGAMDAIIQFVKDVEQPSCVGHSLTVGELREKYIKVFGEETRSYHKAFLRKRIAWRLQALAEGGLSERARRRAGELANDADLRLRAPRDQSRPGSAAEQARTTAGRLSPSRDRRLPLPGTLLVRTFQGRDLVVQVLDDGFAFEGRRYR